MVLTIDSLLEGMANCSGRFRTMKNVFPLCDSQGRPVFTSCSRTVSFLISWNGRDHIMRCPLMLSPAEKAAAEKHAFGSMHFRCGHIIPCEYRKSEFLVYDTGGNPHREDVILEEYPEGEPFAHMIRSRLRSSDRRPFRELLAGLADMAADMDTNGVVHGNLRPENIFVTAGGLPVAVNYALSTAREPEADTVMLSIMAAGVFLLAGEPRIFDLAGRDRLFTPAGFTEHRKEMLVQSEFLRIGPLAELVRTIGSPGIRSRTNFNRLIATLAETPFAGMPLLADMLAEKTGVTSVVSSGGYRPAGIPEKDPSLLVDFRLCELVGPLSDNTVAFRQKGKWDYADRYGVRLTGSGFLDAGNFYEGRAAVRTSEGWGMIDRRGNYILPPGFETLEWLGPDNVAAACSDGKWELYDREGKQLTSGAYDWMGDCSEGVFTVRRGNRFGYLLPDGSPLTEMRFDDAYSFRDGKAMVRTGAETFHIGRDGYKIT